MAASGGAPRQVQTTPALYAVYDRAGKRLAYSDVNGYEMEWRKHDNSSFARDVWLWDVAGNQHRRLTAFGADDRQPVWTPDQRGLYYLSERSGTFNVWRLDLADPEHPVQVTSHAVHPVRFLSSSDAGDLCYAWDGEIWLRPAGADASRKLEVTVAVDRRENAATPLDVSGEVSEFELSPDAREVAFVARGEVFVASVEHGTTRRITNTPEQERSVSFSPDGRSLEIHWDLIRAACASVADTAVHPMQDVLGLAGEHRMNLPGRGEGYWQWRFSWQQVRPEHAQRLAHLARLFRRDGTPLQG